MPLTAERAERAFTEAKTFQEFVDTMTVNQEAFLANYAAYELSEEDRAFFAGLPQPLRVLALAHDWCGDVVANTPLFGKIAAETGKLSLFLLPRDPDNLDIAAEYPAPDGLSHIPTYIFFDQAGIELGVFIERPALITSLMQQWRQTFFHDHPKYTDSKDQPLGEMPAEVQKPLLAYFKKQRAAVRQDEKREIIEAIKRIAGQPVSLTP